VDIITLLYFDIGILSYSCFYTQVFEHRNALVLEIGALSSINSFCTQVLEYRVVTVLERWNVEVLLYLDIEYQGALISI